MTHKPGNLTEPDEIEYTTSLGASVTMTDKTPPIGERHETEILRTPLRRQALPGRHKASTCGPIDDLELSAAYGTAVFTIGTRQYPVGSGHSELPEKVGGKLALRPNLSVDTDSMVAWATRLAA